MKKHLLGGAFVTAIIAVPMGYGALFGAGLRLGWWSLAPAILSLVYYLTCLSTDDHLFSWRFIYSEMAAVWVTVLAAIAYSIIAFAHGASGPLSLLFFLVTLLFGGFLSICVIAGPSQASR